MKRLLGNWWAQRAPRERWLAGAVVVVAVGASADTLWLAPERAATARAAHEFELARKRLQQTQALAAQQASDGESVLRGRRAALQERRAQAMHVINAAQIDLIAPQEMVRQLEAILVRHPTLRFVAMQSAGPKPLVEGGNGGGVGAGVYQHGLQVQIEGPYLDLLAYLEALERAPYRIYWRELDLRVGASGVPLTRLMFFTLSRESAWLRL